MATTGLATILGLVFLASVSRCTSLATTALAIEHSVQLQNPMQQYHSEENPGKNCYKAMCWCLKTVADCSRNYGNLTFIPKMYDDISFLIFSYNKLEEIPDEDFFSNVTGLLYLDLGHNDLHDISQTSFRRLANLESLNLNNNPNLYLPEALPVFDIATLVELEFTSGRLGTLPKDFFVNHTLPLLQKLDLSSSVAFHNGHLDLGLFTPLSRLDTLSLSNNHIISLGSQTNFSSLLQFDLSQNQIDVFPHTCRKGASLYPNLQILNLNFNQIEYMAGAVCLPALRVLSLNLNRIAQLTTDMFSLGKFPSLEQLYVEDMRTKNLTIQEFAFRNSGLRGLSLRYNMLPFGNAAVSERTFSGCSRLQSLNLKANDFSQVSESKLKQLFLPLAFLEYLDLSDIRLASLTSQVLGGMPGLVNLVLWQNALSEIANGTFDGLRNLTWLDLAENSLTGVSEGTFGPETRAQLRHLDVSGNPFTCACSDVWFPLWLKTNPDLFSDSRFDYVCANYNNTNMTSFEDTYCSNTSTTPGAQTTTTTNTTNTTTNVPNSFKKPAIITLYVLAAAVIVVAVTVGCYLLVTRRSHTFFWCWTRSRGEYQVIAP